jgi:hypothetical protein
VALWAAVAVGMLMLSGCPDGPAPTVATPTVRLSVGGQLMESVTTNLSMDPDVASDKLREASRQYAAVIASDKSTPEEVQQGKFGYAMSNTLLGFYDLMIVLPQGLENMLLDSLVQSPSRGAAEPLGQALRAARGARGSSMSTVQLRILGSTMSRISDAAEMFDDVEMAIRDGQVFSLRMFLGGQVRDIAFGVADIQLVAAFSYLVESLLNASIAFNLDMPNNTAVKALPVDRNNNGLFDADEYLIAPPFLDKLYPQGLSGMLQNLRYAAVKAQSGASLSGHTMGAGALLDVTDPATKKTLEDLGYYAGLLSTACTSEVTTTGGFSDGVNRTINLPRLASLTSIRALLPSFQKDDLTAAGIWPDPTFAGAFTPGIPQDFVSMKYEDIEKAYR